MSEADVHFELYRHLQNAIDNNPVRGAITYGSVRPEYSQDLDGRADIVVFDNHDDPVFVIEAKRPGEPGNRDIDPYSPDVIRQAFRYAGSLGAQFFCTYNRDRLVAFTAFEQGVPLLERSTKSYTIGDVEAFADTLLDEISRLQAGMTKWDAADDVFVSRVNSLHEYVSPRLEHSLTDQLQSNYEFQQDFTSWTAAQGIEYSSADADEQETIRGEFAAQAAYLLINKIIFYKILESAPTYQDDVQPLAVSPLRVQEDLDDFFQHIVDDIDFEAIYEHDDVYSEIPLDPVADKIRDFIIELDDEDLTQFDSDVIGRIYEGVIPPERRRAMGEYYTPPAICDLIVRLTVDSVDNTVLDPACGSGGFLVSSYHRIKDLLPEPNGSHERILTQLSGVEINRFPAHLSAINLAIQDLTSYTERVDIEIADFFDVKRYQRFQRQRASAEGEAVEENDVAEQVGGEEGFNAVLANPPYIRQENIDDKKKVREHLQSKDLDADYISRRSDIYAYFLTHATDFIADDGKLGFITSDRWLDTQYGEDLQQFILENYCINAIIKFDRQVFDDALVGSSIIILQRQPNQSRRENNVAKFLQLREELDIEEIVDIVEDDIEPDKMISNEDYRLVTQTQEALSAEKKWNLFFMAPPVYFEIRSNSKVTTLDDVAEVTRGITSGANAFFYGRREDFVQLGIEDYTTNLLKATGQIEKIRFDEVNAKEWGVLDLHDLVTTALEESDEDFGESKQERVKKWLTENGHRTLVEYINTGEENEYHNRKSFRDKDIWFDLGDVPIAPILNTRFTWREHRMVWNEAEAIADQQFYMIQPDNNALDLVLCGILNSRLSALTNELLGRRAGGEGMTRLQKAIYETEMLPIPDPNQLTDAEWEDIEIAVQNLMDREEELGPDSIREDKEEELDELDRAVMRTIGLENRMEEVKEAVQRLIDSRDKGAGQKTKVMVDRLRETEKSEAIDLPGVDSARESTT